MDKPPPGKGKPPEVKYKIDFTIDVVKNGVPCLLYSSSSSVPSDCPFTITPGADPDPLNDPNTLEDEISYYEPPDVIQGVTEYVVFTVSAEPLSDKDSFCRAYVFLQYDSDGSGEPDATYGTFFEQTSPYGECSEGPLLNPLYWWGQVWYSPETDILYPLRMIRPEEDRRLDGKGQYLVSLRVGSFHSASDPYQGFEGNLHDPMGYIAITVIHPVPVVTITSPPNGSSFASTDPILFAGTAFDKDEDGAYGDITGLLEWYSDDSYIVGGASFSTSLPPGTHTITARATDTEGYTGSDIITIAVDDMVPLDVEASTWTEGP